MFILQKYFFYQSGSGLCLSKEKLLHCLTYGGLFFFFFFFFIFFFFFFFFLFFFFFFFLLMIKLFCLVQSPVITTKPQEMFVMDDKEVHNC